MYQPNSPPFRCCQVSEIWQPGDVTGLDRARKESRSQADKRLSRLQGRDDGPQGGVSSMQEYL